LIYNRNYNIPVSIVRYSNVYGYGQSPRNPYCGVLGKFIHNSLTSQPLTVVGDGEQTRDYTFITDAVDATILAAVHPMAYGDVFNVGSGIETSVNRLANLISDYVKGATISHVAERDIDNIRRRVVDIEKIHQRLGWVPKMGLQKGIESTIDWYKTIL
jgi:UDP-glucose 4-epimerase